MYDALIKKPGVDMLLPCVMAMDKTHIDMAGRLQMGPITIPHGLLNHIFRRLPSAMCILGYINHSIPANLHSDAEIDPKFNAPADLPKGVHHVNNAIRCPDENVSWATLLLNKTHMQIQFILEESGFCSYKSTASDGICSTTEQCTLPCSTRMSRSSLVTQRITTTA